MHCVTYEEDGYSLSEMWRLERFPLYCHFSEELAEKVLRNLQRLDTDPYGPFSYLLTRAKFLADALAELKLEDREQRTLLFPWLRECLTLLEQYPENPDERTDFYRRYKDFQDREFKRLYRYFHFEIEKAKRLENLEEREARLKDLSSLLRLWGQSR